MASLRSRACALKDLFDSTESPKSFFLATRLKCVIYRIYTSIERVTVLSTSSESRFLPVALHRFELVNYCHGLMQNLSL